MKSKIATALIAILTSGSALGLLSSCGGLEAAEKAYALGEYQRAVGLFEGVQKGEKNKSMRGKECFYIGECYRHLSMPSKAASAYMRAIRYEYDDDEALLRLADCYRAMGRFDEADEAYEQYKTKHKTDKRTAAGLASSALGRINWEALSSKNQNQVDSGYVVSSVREFNSKFSDFCPVFVGDTYDVVYFTSMRTEKKHRKKSKITGQGNSTIYMTRVDARGKWTTPEALGEPFGQSHKDDGVACISSDGSTMFFTRCPLNENEGNAAQTYETKREGGRWSEPVRVTPGGDSTMMVAHPAISPDGQTLYYVSDKEEGGMGGTDIWMSKKNSDNSWGPAQNLGALINTAGDEMFPYVRQNGTLYFSSNGHKGYGGLDIYKVVELEGGIYNVVNMGLPLNSAGDDFGIAFMGTAEEGFLSSNRNNPKGIDAIYTFNLPPVVLTIEGMIGSVGGASRSADQIVADRLRAAKEAAEAKAKAEEETRLEAEKAAKSTNRKPTAKPGNNKAGAKTTNKHSQTPAKASASTKKNEKTAEPILVPVKDSFVRIIGSDGTNLKLTPTEKGIISFVAERDVHYIILSGAPGYANVRTELSTEGLNKTQTLKFTANLEKVELNNNQ